LMGTYEYDSVKGTTLMLGRFEVYLEP